MFKPLTTVFSFAEFLQRQRQRERQRQRQRQRQRDHPSEGLATPCLLELRSFFNPPTHNQNTSLGSKFVIAHVLKYMVLFLQSDPAHQPNWLHHIPALYFGWGSGTFERTLVRSSHATITWGKQAFQKELEVTSMFHAKKRLGGREGGLDSYKKSLFIISSSRQWKYFCGYLNPHTELRKVFPAFFFIS